MRSVPPSVLPDISPSRGEIRWSTASPFRNAEGSECDGCSRQDAGDRPISPLEGEMSGRTEGGVWLAPTYQSQAASRTAISRSRSGNLFHARTGMSGNSAISGLIPVERSSQSSARPP